MLMFLRFHQLLDVNELYQLKKPHLCNNSPVSFIRCSLCKEYLILFHWNFSHEPIAHTTGMSGTTSGGGGVLPYMAYTGMCRWTGYVSTKTERVVLNRVCILGIFRPKQGQGFKPSAVHLYPNIGGLKCESRRLLFKKVLTAPLRNFASKRWQEREIEQHLVFPLPMVTSVTLTQKRYPISP